MLRLTINPKSETDVARVRDILEREFALHWPQSPKLKALDLLAEDYASDCRSLTMEEFREACRAARPRARYWPTPAAVLEAAEALAAQARATTAEVVELTPPVSEEELDRSRMWLRRIRTDILERVQ